MAITKPSKAFIKDHLAYFGIMAALIILEAVWTAASAKYFVKPGGVWALFIFLSLAFIYGTYQFCRKDDRSSPDFHTGAKWWYWAVMAGVYFITFSAINATARSNRVDNCTPKENLTPEKTPEAWVKWYKDNECPAVLIDAPAEEYVLTNHKKPFWLMDRSGYTSDPVGWWKYYYGNPKNPYPLTKEVQDTLYQTNFLPKRLIGR